jgi:hypothetical protein
MGLTELANMYGTDKGTLGPSDDWGSNNYTDIYAAYLDSMRRLPIAFLEIGLGVVGDRWASHIVHGRNAGGASVKMWQEYFPKAMIYGIDVNACAYLDTDRVRTFVADQGDPRQLQDAVDKMGDGRFDVIIDDGSHRPDHQQISLAFLFPLLKPGGIYFIEDLGDNGQGDNLGGRHANDSVLNTRRVLKHYCEHGTFPSPNGFGVQGAALGQMISSVAFHCPESVVETTDAGPRIRYRVGAEKLCALRKK